MKRMVLLLLLLAACGCAGDGLSTPPRVHAQRLPIAPAGSAASPSPPVEEHPVSTNPSHAAPGPFERLARPVLARRCAPCHEPGGKMYDKMPFDKAHVVSSHSAGILKRLDGDDRQTIQQWLAGSPATKEAL